MKKIELENGYIKLTVDDMEDTELVIDMVEVKEKRQGTGRKLVEMAIEYAKEEGFKKLTLSAYPQDDSIEYDDLIDFYRNLGFEIEYDDGANGALMYYEL